MLLDGRTALVTGGARGIGREIVITLARQGAAVVAADILLEELEDLSSFARDRKLSVFCKPMDATSPEQWSHMARYIEGEFQKLDILVNNAGMMRSRPFFETTLEDFQTTMRVNVESMFLGAQALGVVDGQLVGLGPLVGAGPRAGRGRCGRGFQRAGPEGGPWGVAFEACDLVLELLDLSGQLLDDVQQG